MPEIPAVQGMPGPGVFQIVSTVNVPFFMRPVKEAFCCENRSFHAGGVPYGAFFPLLLALKKS